MNAAAKILAATGGSGGDLNAYVAYHYQYRDRPATGGAWGAWVNGGTFGASSPTGATVAVTVTPGVVRQFRVRTMGSAGSDYYSGWVLCGTVLTGNAAPGAPTVALPASGATAKTTAPTIVIQCPAEPDGGAQTLMRRVDGGAWTAAGAVTAAGATVYDVLPALTAGSHTVEYKLVDAYSSEGGAASVSFLVSPPEWARTIATGTVISNAVVSHRADIAELLAAVNAARAFYGLAAIALPGAAGAFAAWRGQMLALQSGLTGAHAAAGRAAPVWTAVPTYPTAAIVNELRARIP